jgi:hypothetical protein
MVKRRGLSDSALVAIMLVPTLLTVLFYYLVITTGLGALNSITSLFGINIINGLLAAFFQPIALIIGAFLFLFIIWKLSGGLFGHEVGSLNTIPLVLMLGLSSLAFKYGLTGSFLAIGSSEIQMASVAGQNFTYDLPSTLAGMFVGMVVVFLLNKKVLRRR